MPIVQKPLVRDPDDLSDFPGFMLIEEKKYTDALRPIVEVDLS